MTAALEGCEWSAARPGHTLPPGKTRYPLYRRLGGPPGPVWTGGKSRPHRDSIPDRPTRSSVVIPTELPGPHVVQLQYEYIHPKGQADPDKKRPDKWRSPLLYTCTQSVFCVVETRARAHTHTHTHIYIYIYNVMQHNPLY